MFAFHYSVCSWECLSPSCNFRLAHLIIPSTVPKAKSGNKQTHVLAMAAALHKPSVFLFRETGSSVSHQIFSECWQKGITSSQVFSPAWPMTCGSRAKMTAKEQWNRLAKAPKHCPVSTAVVREVPGLSTWSLRPDDVASPLERWWRMTVFLSHDPPTLDHGHIHC